MSERTCRICGEPSGTRMYCSDRCKARAYRLRGEEHGLSFARRVEIPLHTAHDLRYLGISLDDPDELGKVLAVGATNQMLKK